MTTDSTNEQTIRDMRIEITRIKISCSSEHNNAFKSERPPVSTRCRQTLSHIASGFLRLRPLGCSAAITFIFEYQDVNEIINCSYNNMSKGICFLNHVNKKPFLFIQEKFIQVRAFESNIPLRQVFTYTDISKSKMKQQ